ncbi:YceI family protein [Bdellovibrio sp. HCB288]|uniref:YceI family protein n=1 Tax=Bdellovibrio sp. HCB288 TaxID=3394355 RepID=UPI0039B4812C
MKMMTATTATIITLLSTAAFAKSIPAGTYTLDSAHSQVGFEVPHLVISSVDGRFTKFDGSITIDSKLEKSKANLNVDVNSIDTANADRDKHLKSPDFFDAAKNPTMKFVTKKVIGSADDLRLVGDLTIKGKTKEITLAVKYLGDVKDAYGNQKIAFTATGKINRQEFGLTWSQAVEAGPVVGDEITLNIKIQGNKPVDKKG